MTAAPPCVTGKGLQAESFDYEYATEPPVSDAVRPQHERKNGWPVATAFEHAVLIKTFEAYVETLKAQLSAAEARFAEQATEHAAEQSARIKSLENHVQTLMAQLSAAEVRAERRAAEVAARSAQHVAEQAALIKTHEAHVETLKVQLTTAEANAERQTAVADQNAQHVAKKAALIEALETQVETLKAQLSAAEVRAELQAAELAGRLAEGEAAIAAERAKTEAERAKTQEALARVERLASERRKEEPEPAASSWWLRGLPHGRPRRGKNDTSGRELTEPAAALSGAEDETRIADRIADQERLLARTPQGTRAPSQIASHDLLATEARNECPAPAGLGTPFSNSRAGARLSWRRLG